MLLNAQLLGLPPCLGLATPSDAGHVRCAEVLLKAGASADGACDGNPPLHMAVCTASLPGRAESAHALVQLLLAAGAQPTEW